MIENENQYKVTTRWINENTRVLEQIRTSPYVSDATLHWLMQQGIKSQLADLHMERADYRRKHRFTVMFKWFDLWIGAFVDTKDKTVYICPLPMVVIRIFYVA